MAKIPELRINPAILQFKGLYHWQPVEECFTVKNLSFQRISFKLITVDSRLVIIPSTWTLQPGTSIKVSVTLKPTSGENRETNMEQVIRLKAGIVEKASLVVKDVEEVISKSQEKGVYIEGALRYVFGEEHLKEAIDEVVLESRPEDNIPFLDRPRTGMNLHLYSSTEPILRKRTFPRQAISAPQIKSSADEVDPVPSNSCPTQTQWSTDPNATELEYFFKVLIIMFIFLVILSVLAS